MGNWRIETVIELYSVKDINSATFGRQSATRSLRVSSENIFQTMYQAHRRKLNPHGDVCCIPKIIHETNLDIGDRHAKCHLCVASSLEKYHSERINWIFSFFLFFPNDLIYLFIYFFFGLTRKLRTFKFCNRSM